MTRKRQNRKERRLARRKKQQAKRREQRRLDRLADRQHDQDQHDHDNHDHDQDRTRIKINLGYNENATPDQLIGDSTVNWNSEIFTNRVQDGIFDVEIDTSTMGDLAETFIRSTISQIDEITGIKVHVGRPGAFPDLVIERTNDWSEYASLSDNENLADYAGLAFFNDGKAHATWKTTTLEGSELSSETKYVINHEILHGFGLMHPDNDGFNEAFNANDTLMSYNRTGNSQLTKLDLAALSSLWG